LSELGRAAETVVRRCLGVRQGEDVLVICDATTLELAEALRAEAAAAGADAVLARMEERATNGTEPPPPLAAALAAVDAYLAPTAKSLSHTRARKAATDAGVRGASMPGVTVDMLARVMSVDFDAMAARGRAVAELLDASDEAHVSCPLGSDLRLDLSGRRGIVDDGDLRAPGAFGNLPCGEGFIAPAGGEGVISASVLPPDGIAEEPARLTVRDGALAGADGAAGERFVAMIDPHGPAGRNLAELGVGTNDRAGLTGNILEDEKALGTVHVAFGASAGIGGTVSVPIHLDVVVTDATLMLGDTTVLDAGRFVL
jgi:leucyl aminopeptidase (aminopeptidase T)